MADSLRGNQMRNVWLLGLILLGTGMLSYRLYRWMEAPKKAEETRVSKPQANAPATGLRSFESLVPFEWKGDLQTVNPVQFNVVLSRYQDSYSVRAIGDLVPQKNALQSVRLRMELLDGAGKVVGYKFQDVLYSHQPVVRPEDVLPVSLLIYEKGVAPDVQRVRLWVDRVIEASAAPSAILKPVEIRWPGEAPAQMRFKLWLREARNSTYNGQGTVAATFLIRNEGQRPIERLQIKLAYEKQGTEVASALFWTVMESSTPPLRPQTQRGFQHFMRFETATPEYDRITATVSEIR